jgi:hypothetical protein
MRRAWRSLRLPGQHFGDVQHARGRVAAAAQSALDVEHAAEVSEHHGIGAAGGNIAALVVCARNSPNKSKVPPNPQQVSQSVISVIAQASRRAACAAAA